MDEDKDVVEEVDEDVMFNKNKRHNKTVRKGGAEDKDWMELDTP